MKPQVIPSPRVQRRWIASTSLYSQIPLFHGYLRLPTYDCICGENIQIFAHTILKTYQNSPHTHTHTHTLANLCTPRLRNRILTAETLGSNASCPPTIEQLINTLVVAPSQLMLSGRTLNIFICTYFIFRRTTDN